MCEVEVRILLFAKAQDLSGKKEDTLKIISEITYEKLLELIVNHYKLHPIKKNLILAINEEFCQERNQLQLTQGDTIAVIPPLSGGVNKSMDDVKLVHNELTLEDLYKKVVADDCGAVSIFTGTTRNNYNNKIVTRLIYEAYETMAISCMKKICQEIRKSWCEIRNIAIHHRLGEVSVGETSIIIAISSPHRNDSLDAVRFAINQIKSSVPIFKKEIYHDDEYAWKENHECAWSTN